MNKDLLNNIKYLINNAEVEFEDANNSNDIPFENRSKFLFHLATIAMTSSITNLRSNCIFKIYTSQIKFLEQKDLKELLFYVKKIIIADDCNIYKELIKLKERD